MMGWAEIIKSLALLLWPLVVAFIAVSYKPELLSFLPPALRRKFKIKMAGLFEVEVEAAAEQQKSVNLAKVDPNTAEIKLKNLPGLSRTKAIASVEMAIHTKLQQNNIEDPVALLVRELAQTRLEALFGYIYAGIFGSQILGLRELEARRRVSTDEAFKFYQQFETKFPEVYDGYGFPGWLGFLKIHHLIEQRETDIIITDIGDDFLKWLRSTGLSVEKSF